MARILLLQGANMNWLGRREPHLYGTTTAQELDAMMWAYAAEKSSKLEILYTNIEGEAIDRLYKHEADKDIDVGIMNPGGFTYSGYALRDCIKCIKMPIVEVHMTNHYERDIHSVIASASVGVIMGFGVRTYFRAFDMALEIAADTP